ncbi:MAG: hypothetical protein CVU39_16135 [Chloroflexi bacterium HGW-Chloroflexi-10]|nr:MAG: hypothetical protein CVU39_16135 [Chloroflexi bacterium HGW-Chloroflexi-10]
MIVLPGPQIYLCGLFFVRAACAGDERTGIPFQPLYSSDGGHCKTFRDFDGNTWLSIHHPDGFPGERPKFLSLAQDTLEKLCLLVA